MKSTTVFKSNLWTTAFVALGVWNTCACRGADSARNSSGRFEMHWIQSLPRRAPVKLTDAAKTHMRVKSEKYQLIGSLVQP